MNHYYQKIFKKAQLFSRFTGLSLSEFGELSQELKPLWDKAEEDRLSRDDRKRRIGGGRGYKLESFESKLSLILISYKLYLTYDVLSFIFGLDQGNISKLVDKLEPVLAQSHILKLSRIEIKRDRDKKISSVEELLKFYPEMKELVADATEQQIARPKDKRNKKKYYSGKKKRHTIKTQLLIELHSGKILDISSPFPGRVHDYTIFKETKLSDKIPPDSPLYLDKGYDGATKDFPDHHIIIPKKANRWHKLSKKDRLENRKIGRKRIKVEHAILKCKQFKMLSYIFRHPLQNYGRKFRIIAGLVNFKGQHIIKQIHQTVVRNNLGIAITTTS